MAWALENGIVTGYDADTFGPDDPVTREQLAAILYRYAKTKGLGFDGLWAFRLDFSDADEVSDWAYEAVCWAVANGVMQGVGGGRLAPKASASRAQIATMLMRFSALTGGSGEGGQTAGTADSGASDGLRISYAERAARYMSD